MRPTGQETSTMDSNTVLRFFSKAYSGFPQVIIIIILIIFVIVIGTIVIIVKNAITMNNINWSPGASQHWIILTDGSALVSANNLLRNVITEHLTRNIVLTYLGRFGTTATSHRI